MKKNITINMCGRLYAIDEDAYELMSHYIDTLRNYFRNQDGGEEIAGDIENRMAELFDELKAQGTEAITIEHVQDIIHRIGDLKDIIPEEAQDGTKQQSSNTGRTGSSKFDNYINSLKRKRFYRNPADKKFFGVLSGCAQFFGGSPTIWRVVFIVLLFCEFGVFVSALNVFQWINPVHSFQFALPAFSFNWFFVICYFVIAIIAPEARQPEERIKMKGEEVTPQRLADEVTVMNAEAKTNNKKNYGAWDIISGTILVILTLFFGSMLLVAIIIAAIGLFSTTFFVENFIHFGNSDPFTIYEAIKVPMWWMTGLIIANIGIVTYCCIHGFMSSFKKVKPMSVLQRCIWLLIWIASVVAIVGLTAKCLKDGKSEYDQEWNASHTHDGIVWNNDEDYDYFCRESWKLIDHKGCGVYFTNNGKHYSDNYDARYLDTYNTNREIRYTAERYEHVEPGVYRLYAACRTDVYDGPRIYACVGHSIAEAGDSITILSTPISARDNEGGTIYEWAQGEISAEDAFIPQYMREDSTLMASIRDAHDGKGWGWSFVVVDFIEVKEPANVYYGVTVDPDAQGKCSWFSACDFLLEKTDLKPLQDK